MHWRTFLTVENVYHSQIREIISNPAIYRWRVRFLSYLPMTFSLDWEVIVPDVGVWSPTVITWHNTNQNQIPLSWNTIAHSFGGGDHISCSSVAKTQSVSNYSKITAWDSAAYPSVTLQRVILSCLSHSGSMSNLKHVCAYTCVFVTSIHEKECMGQKPSQSLTYFSLTLLNPSFCMHAFF